MHSTVLLALLSVMRLSSPDFGPYGRIPAVHLARPCGGANRPLEFRWSGVPKGTRSFALVVHDVDAPRPGGYDHWIVFNIPASARRLDPTTPGTTGTATNGRAAYTGPCPPPGRVHHYVVTLYALDEARIGGGTALQASALHQLLRGHVLARAVLVGLDSTPR